MVFILILSPPYAVEGLPHYVPPLPPSEVFNVPPLPPSDVFNGFAAFPFLDGELDVIMSLTFGALNVYLCVFYFCKAALESFKDVNEFGASIFQFDLHLYLMP